MIGKVLVMQHHRQPSTQISRKLVVLRYIVAGFGWFWLVLWVVLAGFGGGFGWFWLVPCFSNYGHNLCVSCICDGEYKLKNMLS